MFHLFKPNGSEADGERSGRLRMLIILGGALLGVFLLLYGGGTFRSEKAEEADVEKYSLSEDELIVYQSYLEERIEALCESVSGVSNVTVFVSLESGYESVYATEEKEEGEEYVILGSGSSSTALFLTRQAPKICGIGIVCVGGSNATVRRDLTELLCATFRLSSNRIYVTDSGG